MSIRRTLVLVIMVLASLSLLAAAPAFAQGATDDTNVCHAINPLHDKHFPQGCASEFDWQVGWCLSQVFQQNMKFVHQWRLGQFNDTVQNFYFPRDDHGNVRDGYAWPPNMEFYRPLCRILFRGDKTREDYASWTFYSSDLGTWTGHTRYFERHPEHWDYWRDRFSAQSTTDPASWVWVNRRSLTLVSHAECLSVTGWYSC